MDNPFEKKIHLDILEHICKGKKLKELELILGENYENIKFHLKEMRNLSGANTNIELGAMAGHYHWVTYP